MAVKKHELVHDNCNQLDLEVLGQYIRVMNDEPTHLPAPQELVKNCQDIVRCLCKFISHLIFLFLVLATEYGVSGLFWKELSRIMMSIFSPRNWRRRTTVDLTAICRRVSVARCEHSAPRRSQRHRYCYP